MDFRSSWERLPAEVEGDDRGWDGWMASLTQWTWVWVGSAGVGDGQGGLVCCSPWGHKESDRTEWLNWTELKPPWFNTKAGSQEIPEVTGKFDLRVQNEVGQKLIEFCQENALVIANTLSQQHKRRLYPWTSPDGQYWNQIDYILCSQRWRSSIQSAKTRLGGDCGSDPDLLIAKFRFKLKKVLKPPGFTIQVWSK